MKNSCKKALALMFITVSVMSAQEPVTSNNDDSASQKRTTALRSFAELTTLTGLASGAAYALNAKYTSGVIAGFMSSILLGKAFEAYSYIAPKKDVTDEVVPTLEQKIKRNDRLTRVMRISSLIAAGLSAGSFYASTCMHNLWAKGFMGGLGMIWATSAAVGELMVQIRLKPQKKQLLSQNPENGIF